MSLILKDGFKVVKNQLDEVILCDYQVESEGNITICEIKLNEKRNVFKFAYCATKTQFESILKKACCFDYNDKQLQKALKLASKKRKELQAKSIVMLKAN